MLLTENGGSEGSRCRQGQLQGQLHPAGWDTGAGTEEVGILALDSNIGLVFMMDPVVWVATGLPWSVRLSELARDDLMSY